MMARTRFHGKRGEKVMAAVEKKTVHQVAVYDDFKRLKLVEVSVSGSTEQVLFNLRAVLNVMVAVLCFQLHFQPHRMN